MPINRKSAIRALAVLSVALGAGQLVQSKPAHRTIATIKADSVEAFAEEKSNIVILNVAAEPALAPDQMAAGSAVPVPHSEATFQVASAGTEPTIYPAPIATAPVEKVSQMPDDCPTSLELTAEPNAMIKVSIAAPCHSGERIVLRHSGLAVTGKIPADGAFSTRIPALEMNAAVDVKLSDGFALNGTVILTDFAGTRRFGVQWQGLDRFQLNAFADGARYGEAGHISSVRMDDTGPETISANAGYLTLVGDGTTDLPLLAEIYTFPADPTIQVNVVVEAEVTDTTCGHEILSETLSNLGGTLTVTDLTLAMPDCDAIGDFLVLNNLLSDMKIASSN